MRVFFEGDSLSVVYVMNISPLAVRHLACFKEVCGHCWTYCLSANYVNSNRKDTNAGRDEYITCSVSACNTSGCATSVIQIPPSKNIDTAFLFNLLG